MCKRRFGFLVVAFLLTCTQAWAAGKVASSPAVAKESESIAHTYSVTITSNFEAAVPPECTGICSANSYTPGDNVSRLFEFSGSTDTLEIKFRKVNNPGFSLTIMRQELSTDDFAARLPGGVFPPGSTCYVYTGSPSGTPCVVYDAFGTLPQKGTDYLGPVTWTLIYVTTDSSGNPALGHAKGTSTTYGEDILQSYSTFPVSVCTDCLGDPTMQGNSDGLSSVATIKQPTGTDSFCWVSPASDGLSFQVGKEIEVEFQLFASGCSGTPIRDKDARL